MTIQEWSEDVLLSQVNDDPQFTDEINSLIERVRECPHSVVVDFSGVTFINSSNIARLLRLRQAIQTCGGKLVLCKVNTQVWGVFLVTGLDKLFDFKNDVTTALATLQMV